MRRLVVCWIHWRYGEVYALRPPLRWWKFGLYPTFAQMLRYVAARSVWEIEGWLWAKYGEQARADWLRGAEKGQA